MCQLNISSCPNDHIARSPDGQQTPQFWILVEVTGNYRGNVLDSDVYHIGVIKYRIGFVYFPTQFPLIHPWKSSIQMLIISAISIRINHALESLTRFSGNRYFNIKALLVQPESRHGYQKSICRKSCPLASAREKHDNGCVLIVYPGNDFIWKLPG